MNKNYFNVLIVCVALSIAVLVGGALFSLPRTGMFFGAILPLIYYHLFYLAPKAKVGLSSTAIDSVYYFGFLVTIAALGISAYSVAMKGAVENVNTVVLQFGVGLIATGYAVVARMHLSSISSTVMDASPEAVMDRYVKQSMDLVTNVDLASAQLTELSRNLMVRTTQTAEASRIHAERTITGAVLAFDAEMKASLAIAKEGLIEIRGLVADTTFVSEREELGRSIRATIDSATKLNQVLDALALAALDDVTVTKQAAQTAAELDDSLRNFNTRLVEFGGADGTLIRSAVELRKVTDEVSSGSAAMAVATTGLSEMAEVLADAGPTFKNMRTLAKRSSTQLDLLSQSSQSLDVALQKISEGAIATHSLADGLTRVDAALLPLAESAAQLGLKLEQAGKVSKLFEEQLSALPRQAATLGKLNEQVADALRQLATQAEISIRSVDGANQLLKTAVRLEETIAALQKSFDGLGGTATEAQKSLSESVKEIKGSIATSAHALEIDVQRSARAATMLTEKLAQVAQGIIDRTREQRNTQ